MEETGKNPGGIGRREFFANCALAACGALGLGTLAARFGGFLYPVVAPEQVLEVDAGSMEELPESGGKVLHLPTGAIALIRAGDDVKAFSAICTHLGCVIQWQPSEKTAFFCPCHRGAYDREGRVVSGPPPNPLTRLPVAVRDGRVFVKVKLRPPQTDEA